MKGIIEETISQNSSMYSRYLMGKARHAMLRVRQKELSPYHISPRQAQIISIIHQLHKTTLVELAKYSNRGINTISNQMTVLVKDGLVKKVREKPKSTLLSFELTEKGVTYYSYIKPNKAELAIMSVLSEEERQQLIFMLEKIISKAEKYKI